MSIKNTLLGGADFPTPDARIKPTDLNDTFDAVAERFGALGPLWVDTAQTIFNQMYLGIDSRLAGGLGLQLKNVYADVFTSDSAISKTGFSYNSGDDNYLYDGSTSGANIIIGESSDLGKNVTNIIPVVNTVGMDNLDLKFSNDNLTWESCTNGEIHIPTTTGQKALLKISSDFSDLISDYFIIYGKAGSGTIYGYSWTGSAWTSNSSIVSGISTSYSYTSPTVFEISGTRYLIIGEGNGTFIGYYWTGSAWATSSSIISGLVDVGTYSKPKVFELNGTTYLIAGAEDGKFDGYYWTGSAWATSSSIIGGLSDVGQYSTPTIFEYDGDYYLITGERYGTFIGYKWTGSIWASDTAIVSGLSDVGDRSTPNVFYIDDTMYMIAGEESSVANGYSWTGSAWTSNSSIVSGLSSQGQIASTVFSISGSAVTEAAIKHNLY